MRRPQTHRPAITPARPSTSAQLARYARMLRAAMDLLALGGEDALQMKELADRADVSLATLYRYFPSKDYVLLAISSSRYEHALQRIIRARPHGASARERVANHLLREFGAEQRDERLTAAILRVLADTRPEYGPLIQQVNNQHMAILQQVAAPGRSVSSEEYRRLQIVNTVFGFATRRWLAGVSSASDARFEIRMVCFVLGGPGVFLQDDSRLEVPTVALSRSGTRPCRGPIRLAGLCAVRTCRLGGSRRGRPGLAVDNLLAAWLNSVMRAVAS